MAIEELLTFDTEDTSELLVKAGLPDISFAESNPDIVFVDIMMPRLDGYQTCALIKNSQNYQNIPVIMLSSKDGLFDQAKGRVVGSDEYLTKPFSKDELLNAIRNHVTA